MLDKTLNDDLKKLIALLDKHGLDEIEVERKGTRLKVRRGGTPSIALAAAPAMTQGITSASKSGAKGAAAPVPEGTPVPSPFVGTFYRSPSPGEKPFVSVGDLVEKGKVLCIVESMKLMNEIEAPLSGRVQAILAEDIKPVEYGQTLFIIASAS